MPWTTSGGQDKLHDGAIVIPGGANLAEPIREANRPCALVQTGRGRRDGHSNLAVAATSYAAVDPAPRLHAGPLSPPDSS
jgi:hypothetical protein